MPWYRLLYSLGVVPVLGIAAPFFLAKRGRSLGEGLARMGRILPQRHGKTPGCAAPGRRTPVDLASCRFGRRDRGRAAPRGSDPDAPAGLSYRRLNRYGHGPGFRAKTIPGVDGAFYLPLDHPFLCRRAIERLKPSILVILETEIWPGLFWSAADIGVPLVIVNGRISDRACGRFRKFSWFFRHVLPCVSHILAQSDRDRERFIEAGAPKERISVMGNLKYDGVDVESAAAEREIWRSRLALRDEDVLLVAGSTFEGEEAMLGDIYLSLKRETPELRLLIAPRHVQRADSIVRTLTAKGVSVARRSELDDKPAAPDDLILLDTTGELARVYGAAGIAYLGKSMAARETGGQNPVEPAALGVPVCFGPNMQNFRAIAELLLETGGAVRVEDASELRALIARWGKDAAARRTIGSNAETCIERQQGAAQRAAECILGLI